MKQRSRLELTDQHGDTMALSLERIQSVHQDCEVVRSGAVQIVHGSIVVYEDGKRFFVREPPSEVLKMIDEAIE